MWENTDMHGLHFSSIGTPTQLRNKSMDIQFLNTIEQGESGKESSSSHPFYLFKPCINELTNSPKLHSFIACWVSKDAVRSRQRLLAYMKNNDPGLAKATRGQFERVLGDTWYTYRW